MAATPDHHDHSVVLKELRKCQITIGENPKEAVEFFVFHPPVNDATKNLTQCAILLHGFQGSPSHLTTVATMLSDHGYLTIVPKLFSLLGGKKSQERNIQLIEGIIASFLSLFPETGSALSPTDPLTIVLGGHSAGGALALEAAALMCQPRVSLSFAVRVKALILLDAVPFSESTGHPDPICHRTLERIPLLQPSLRILSLQAPPTAWNASGFIHLLLQKICQQIPHIVLHSFIVANATHIDPIDDPGFFIRLLCGGWTETIHSLFNEIVAQWIASDFQSLADNPVIVGFLEDPAKRLQLVSF